jgi:hypothetical protein
MWIRIWIKVTTGFKTPYGSILSLHASIVSVHGPLWLHFEPVKLQNFDFNADPDPASQNNVVTDTQIWFEAFILIIILVPLSFETPVFETRPPDSQAKALKRRFILKSFYAPSGLGNYSLLLFNFVAY